MEMCFPDTSVLLRDSDVLISLIVAEPKEALQRNNVRAVVPTCTFSANQEKLVIIIGRG